ncbi:PREDICTED: uncharacterized protein LOC104747696 isoform X2 [Camelina sativa]|uniref:Uncharacterized protein LOC104747696 isoform X2 n=1 Tax=Camelina sativa TaxID=90675 RepID=A0ABM0W9L5_CAMSA|nr:PREDICTED: uncharacterized protein LOC104747696 isoform X2 [Camelina sativa]XP_010467677.1 PREDICTED: uncharacterized protein LOC104747696 isoform X2 [Camelina sativa]
MKNASIRRPQRRFTLSNLMISTKPLQSTGLLLPRGDLICSVNSGTRIIQSAVILLRRDYFDLGLFVSVWFDSAQNYLTGGLVSSSSSWWASIALTTVIILGVTVLIQVKSLLVCRHMSSISPEWSDKVDGIEFVAMEAVPELCCSCC